MIIVKKIKKFLISAAISKFDGHLFKYNFKKKGPCFRCFMPEQPMKKIIVKQTVYFLQLQA